ncbi:translocation/assembly module TamB domain-containing protein [Bowmanella sp. Y26]|uniref:translocation/assembly module TamB domain-containing protein n=1 Tax=Bowmanella yangjiangensis TaxID=2811230 RepID=UPI001BDC0BBD|nr:translocation/assembly module TamB domain-containing protein [Bowmanella yangjiangensis]MBT1062183.1 translocation/assembly module TamB domain-containing protein [Bowmanella yangjiangensis]
MAFHISYKQLLRRLLVGLATLLCMVAGLVYWLTGTESGTGWLLNQAKAHVPGLKNGAHQGSLLYGLQLSDFSYQQPGLLVSAGRIELDISARALLLPHIVVQQLNITDLFVEVEQTDTAATTPSPSQPPSAIALPDWLPTSRIQQLQIEHSQLKLPGLAIAWNNLNLNAGLKDKLFTLNNLYLNGLRLQLNDSSQPAQPSTDWPLAALPDLPAPINIRLNDIQLEDAQIIQAGQKIQINHAMLQMQWLDTKLAIDRLEVRSQQLGTVDLRGSAVLNRPYQVNLEASVLPAEDLLPMPLSTKPIGVNVSGSLEKLLVEVKEPALTALNLHAEADVTQSELPFSAALDVNTAPLVPLLELPEQAEFQSGKLTLIASGNLQQQRADLSLMFSGFGFGQTSAAQLSLKAQHQPGQIESLKIDFIDPVSSSAARVNGELQYGQSWQWQIQGQLHNLQLNSPLLPVTGVLQGSLNNSGTWSNQGWRIHIDDTQLAGSLNDTPLRLSAIADISQQEQLQVSNLDLRLEAFNSTLKLTGTADQQWQLQGKLFSDNLSALPINAQGQIEADFRVSGELMKPLVEMNGKVKQLHVDSLSVQDMGLAANYRPMQQHAGDLSIQFPNIVLSNDQHIHGQLNLGGDAHSHQLQLEIGGDINANLLMQGSADLEQQHWFGKILEADSRMFGEHWRLSAPIELDLTETTQTLSAHCWNGNFSQLCLQQGLQFPGNQPIELSADVDYGRWSSGKLNGQELSGNAHLSASLAYPEQGPMQLHVTLNSSAGHLLQQWEDDMLPLLDWQAGTFKLDSQDDGSLQLSGQLQSKAGQDLLTLNGQLGNKADADISANLYLAPLPLEGFVNLVPQLSKLTGLLSADIQVQGKLNAPRLHGKISLEDTALVVASSQTAVDKLTLNVSFADTQTEFDGQFAMGSGQAKLQGSSHWDASQSDWQNALTLQAKLEGQALQLQALPELQASISPHLDIRFEQGLHLQGKVNVDNGRLTLQELPASAVAVSQDMRLVNQQDIQQSAPLPINLQLDVELVDPFAISGFGFNGKIDGSLTARQKSPDPLELFGALTFTEGLYKAYGQNLEVKSGRLQFLGQASNPTVQLQAIRPLKGTGVEAGIEVSGPVSGLQVRLFSNPSMEQSTILSYILRGKPPGAGGESDGRSMALLMAANQGIGITGASGLTDALNNIPLISDITLDTETDAASGDSLATVSGYIGERIYLKYGVGILEPVTQITVRFYLMNQLWLEAVSSLERSMDLYYSFEVK